LAQVVNLGESNWFELQAQEQIAIIPIMVLIFVFTIVGMAFLWKRGKTAEAISFLNTFLILLVIILLFFPPS
jgi:hypothetical protein